jgi:hypothetical protein
LDLNQGPSGYEPVPQDKAEYTKIEEKLNILSGYEFSGFSVFMLFYANLFCSVRKPLERILTSLFQIL